MSPLEYALLGMAAVFLIPALLIVIIVLLGLFWPVLVGLMLVYTNILPAWTMVIFGVLNFLYWGVGVSINE